jgi:hypothetical protein
VKRAILAVAYAVAGLWWCAVGLPAHADTNTDQYLAELHHYGVDYPPDNAVLAGQDTCVGLRRGMTFPDIAMAQSQVGFNAHDGAMILVAAVDNFCPEFRAALDRYTDTVAGAGR